MRLKIRKEQDILLKRVTLSVTILVVGFSWDFVRNRGTSVSSHVACRACTGIGNAQFCVTDSRLPFLTTIRYPCRSKLHRTTCRLGEQPRKVREEGGIVGWSWISFIEVQRSEGMRSDKLSCHRYRTSDRFFEIGSRERQSGIIWLKCLNTRERTRSVVVLH